VLADVDLHVGQARLRPARGAQVPAADEGHAGHGGADDLRRHRGAQVGGQRADREADRHQQRIDGAGHQFEGDQQEGHQPPERGGRHVHPCLRRTAACREDSPSFGAGRRGKAIRAEAETLLALDQRNSTTAAGARRGAREKAPVTPTLHSAPLAACVAGCAAIGNMAKPSIGNLK
jgi:hypothetical protein